MSAGAVYPASYFVSQMPKQTGNFVSLDYSFLLGKGSGSHTPQKGYTLGGDWGTIQIESVKLPMLTVTHFSANLEKNIHIRHTDPQQCQTVNSCFVVSGKVDSAFNDIGYHRLLTEGKQNFIYKPVVFDDHFIEAGSEPLKLLHLAFDRTYFIDILSGISWCDELRLKIDKKEPVLGGESGLAITPAMRRVMQEIMTCRMSGPLGNLLVEAWALELTAWQLDQYHSATMKPDPVMTLSDRTVFNQLKEYLDNNFCGNHSLKSLSRMFGVNEFKLKKGFRESFGETIFGYIHRLRMQHARALMENRNLSVTEAAACTGYKNPNHFSTAFKKQFGWSPSRIRKTSGMAA